MDKRRLFIPFLVMVLACPVCGRDLHTISIREKGLFPESLDWDRQGGHFVVGSLFWGSVVSVSDAGVVHDLIVDPDFARRNSILGIKVDPRRNRLLAVVHTFSEVATARNLSSVNYVHALAAYDLRSKRRLFLAPLISQEHRASYPNDICVDHRGFAYVTDSIANLVWQVDEGGAASVLVSSPLFSSHSAPSVEGHTAMVGLNGIICVGGGFLVVAQTNTGKLFRVGISEKTVGLVQIDDGLLAGVDGIALGKDGYLVAVSPHRAWLLRSTDLWFTAHIVSELPLDPTLNTTAVAFRDGRRPYVLHSHLQDFLAGVVDREEYSIQQLRFPNDHDDHPAWLVVVVLLFLLMVFIWKFELKRFFRDYNKKRM